nr:GNAT family N-acetyltransferase [uncultured Microbacterium sp.]
MRIGAAGLDDVEGLARLKWRDAMDDEPHGLDFTRFARDLADWWRAHEATHSAFVARREDDGDIIGAAWVALVPRVPRPGAVTRLSADVQSVFVLPEHRGAGTGAALVEAASRHAHARGAARITVHSSEGAVSLYRRAGFEDSPRLRQRVSPESVS